MTVRHLLTYTSGYGYAQYYPAAVKVKHLDILGLDRVAVVGHDSGGMIARHAMAGDPRLRAMGLIDTEQSRGTGWRFDAFLAVRHLPGLAAGLGWVAGARRVRRNGFVLGDAFVDRSLLDGEFDEFFLRQDAHLRAEELAAKAGVKITIPLMMVFGCVLGLVLEPHDVAAAVVAARVGDDRGGDAVAILLGRLVGGALLRVEAGRLDPAIVAAGARVGRLDAADDAVAVATDADLAAAELTALALGVLAQLGRRRLARLLARARDHVVDRAGRLVHGIAPHANPIDLVGLVVEQRRQQLAHAVGRAETPSMIRAFDRRLPACIDLASRRKRHGAVGTDVAQRERLALRVSDLR